MSGDDHCETTGLINNGSLTPLPKPVSTLKKIGAGTMLLFSLILIVAGVICITWVPGFIQ
eukprot:gene20828-7722_t